MPLVDWPDLDRRKLLAALEPGGLFSDPGRGAHWAPATRSRYQSAWGRLLTFSCCQDLLRPDEPPAGRATPELVQAWIDHLNQYLSSQGLMSEVEAIHNFLLALEPDHDWRWLTRILHRLRARAAPQLIPPDRLRSIDEIYEAGLRLMRLAESRAWHRPLVDSTMFRDGLMLVLLCVTLFRLKNFAGLRIDEHLIRHGEVVELEVPGEEVKNGKRPERVIPVELIPLFDRYLTYHRPRLLQGRRSQALWITEYGTDASPAVVADRICEQTQRFLGVRISPHRFRHCAATTIATARPELAALLRPLLGHGAGNTAERYYNRAEMGSASRRYSTVMQDLMKQSRTSE